MDTLGVILARAGSVGLKNKHLLDLLGQPVIAYTFDHAQRATWLTRIVVSTDCPTVRRLAGQAGLQVIDRPPELATGSAAVQDVLLHALHTVESSRRYVAEAIVTLYGNVPIRGDDVIDRAIEKLGDTGCDSVRSVCPVGKWHPAWMNKLDGDRMNPVQAGSIHRRQDLAPLYLHDGAVVACSRASLLRGEATPDDPHAFFGIDRRAIETEIGETVEIDAARDLYWAEAVLWEQRQKQSGRLAA